MFCQFITNFQQNLRLTNIPFLLYPLRIQRQPRSGFTNHSKDHFLSVYQRFSKFECNKTSDWLDRITN